MNGDSDKNEQHGTASHFPLNSELISVNLKSEEALTVMIQITKLLERIRIVVLRMDSQEARNKKEGTWPNADLEANRKRLETLKQAISLFDPLMRQETKIAREVWNNRTTYLAVAEQIMLRLEKEYESF